MTQQLTEAFRALADDLETGVVGPAPEVVWRHGARRRWRRRGGAGLAVAAVVALFALVLAPAGGLATMPASADRAQGVTAYPQRIGHQWFTRTFRAGDGPIAMLVERVAEHDSHDEPLGWFAVSQSGHQTHLPLVQSMPSLSPDGRWMGYQPAGSGDYLVLGTTSSREVRFAQLGILQDQMPSFWNASGDQVFVPVLDSLSAGAVLRVDGTRVTVPRAPGLVYGWMGEDLVALSQLGPQAGSTGTTFSVEVWRPGRDWTATEQTVTVDRYPGRQGTNQFTASISPDGSRIAVTMPTGTAGTSRVTSYVPGGAPIVSTDATGMTADLRAGSEPQISAPSADLTCPVTWQGNQPLAVLRGARPSGSGGLRLTRWLPSGHEGKAVIVTEKGQGVACMLVAGHAMEGKASWSLLGTADVVAAWWWREFVVGFVVIAIGLGLWRRTRARRRASSAILAP